MLPQQQRERRKLTRNLTFTFGFPSTAVCTWITLLANTNCTFPSNNQLSNHLKKKALYLSVKVFNTKVLISDTIFMSPTGNGTAILCGHRSHGKVYLLALQREYLHFSVILRPWVLVRPRIRYLPLCSQVLILPCWDDFTLIFFGDYNNELIWLIWKMIKR